MLSTFEFSGNVVGIMVQSDIDEVKLNEIHKNIKARFAERKKLNLFVEVERDAKVPFHIIIQDLYFKLKNSGKFSKIAIVTDSTQFTYAVKLKDILLEAEVLAFTYEERLKAVTWIAQ